MHRAQNGWRVITKRGFPHGEREERADADSQSGLCAIDLFITEEGAYTTVASAVAMLVVLVLLFSAVSAVWSLSRSADVQAVADGAALAGSNVVSSYHTAATVVDASIASLGFAGLAITGTGLVALLVPGARSQGVKAIDAGLRILDMRNDFARSASKGLKTLEASLPYLVAANATRLCAESKTDAMTYTGTALAVPFASASEFPALEGEGVNLEALSEAASDLDKTASELEEASRETAQARKRAWIADCGREGHNMQERASSLTGLSPQQNPDYASSVAWSPEVGIARTKAYYQWRLDHEKPDGTSVEAAVDSAARSAFYRYALDAFEPAQVVEYDGSVVSTVPLLPRNKQEIKQTALYTQALWPTTYEPEGQTIHYGVDCPGATGAAGPVISLSAADGGQARTCAVCHFGTSDMGKTPAASTSIDNGYEYHLREYTLALNEYVDCRNRELELEQKAQTQAEEAGDSFEEALSALSSKRPRIAPPGRFGCVAAVTCGEIEAPDALGTSFAASPSLGSRAAVSASALAKDPATRENNVLSQFFSTVEERSSDQGPMGLVGSVMDLWGSLLVSYGDMASGLNSAFDGLTSKLDGMGLGPVGSWLKGRLTDAVRALGLEPVDLSLRKPVLVDSAKVIEKADIPAVAQVQKAVRSIPLSSTDPRALMQALGYQVGEYIAQQEFTIAEIPLPGGGSIPLTIRLRDIAGVAGGDR